MAPQLKLRFQSYFDPLQILVFAAYAALLVLVDIIWSWDFFSLSRSKFRDRAFAKLWLMVFSSSPQDETTAVPALVSSAHGTVIEIGPGSGSHLPHFTALVASGTITKIYGVEPTLALHPALRQAVKKAKLDDVYEIVPCGTEEGETLSRYGLTEGTVDCVISIQVLCSVPRPREVVKELYGLLKPGGEMVIWEHVASTDVISRLVQRIYNPVWSFAVANCQLNRETERYLLEAGNWERVSLEGDKDAGWSVFPRAWGRLVKAREVDEAVKREEEW